MVYEMILLVVVIGVLAWYFIFRKKESAEPSAPIYPPSPPPSPSETPEEGQE